MLPHLMSVSIYTTQVRAFCARWLDRRWLAKSPPTSRKERGEKNDLNCTFFVEIKCRIKKTLKFISQSWNVWIHSFRSYHLTSSEHTGHADTARKIVKFPAYLRWLPKDFSRSIWNLFARVYNLQEYVFQKLSKF